MLFRGVRSQPGVFSACLLGLALAFGLWSSCYGDVLVAKGAGASMLSLEM